MKFVITAILMMLSSFAFAKDLTLACSAKYVVNANDPNMVPPKTVTGATKSDVVTNHAEVFDPEDNYASVYVSDEGISGYLFGATVRDSNELSIYSQKNGVRSPEVTLTVGLNQPVSVFASSNGAKVVVNGENVALYSTTFTCVVTR